MNEPVMIWVAVAGVGIMLTETAPTAHLIVAEEHPGDDFLCQVARELERRFGIGHATLQIELGDGGDACRLAPGDVV